MKEILVSSEGPFSISVRSPIVADDVRAYKLILETGEPVEEGALLKVTGIRDDGVVVTDVGEVSGTKACYVMGESMYAVPGDLVVRLTVVSGSGSVLTRKELIFEVLKANGEPDIAADDRAPALSELILRAAKVSGEAEKQGNYAKEQGEAARIAAVYAKEKGDYAKLCGDMVLHDHELPENCIYIYCDGVNDQIKIQEAISAAEERDDMRTILYPVGDCVLNLGAAAQEGRTVLAFKKNTIFDGRYAKIIVDFTEYDGKKYSPVVFFTRENSTVQNCYITFRGEVIDSYQLYCDNGPGTMLYNNVIVNMQAFSNSYGVIQLSHPGAQLCNNSFIGYDTKSSFCRVITGFSDSCVISGNYFTGQAGNTDYSKNDSTLISSHGMVCNNVFDKMDAGRCGSLISGGQTIVNNFFHDVTGTTFIDATSISQVLHNTFQFCTAVGGLQKALIWVNGDCVNVHGNGARGIEFTKSGNFIGMHPRYPKTQVSIQDNFAESLYKPEEVAEAVTINGILACCTGGIITGNQINYYDEVSKLVPLSVKGSNSVIKYNVTNVAEIGSITDDGGLSVADNFALNNML